MQLTRRITAALLFFAVAALTGCIIWPYWGEGDRGNHEQQDPRGGEHGEGHGDRSENRR
jgi:hypothetical protein